MILLLNDSDECVCFFGTLHVMDDVAGCSAEQSCAEVQHHLVIIVCSARLIFCNRFFLQSTSSSLLSSLLLARPLGDKLRLYSILETVVSKDNAQGQNW